MSNVLPIVDGGFCKYKFGAPSGRFIVLRLKQHVLLTGAYPNPGDCADIHPEGDPDHVTSNVLLDQLEAIPPEFTPIRKQEG